MLAPYTTAHLAPEMRSAIHYVSRAMPDGVPEAAAIDAVVMTCASVAWGPLVTFLELRYGIDRGMAENLADLALDCAPDVRA
jgi:hypothetical protein